MKFSKHQINSLLALGGVTLILFTGMFFLPWVNPAFAEQSPDEPVVPVETVPHDPFRNARPAADSLLGWETNLGGSGDDSVLAAFEIAAGVLIFGNTDSIDYDFKDKVKGCYVILLDFNGKAVNYMTYGGTLSKVVALDFGYLLCVNTADACYLIETDALGIEKRRAELGVGGNEKLIDVYIDFFSRPDTEPYHAVIEFTNPDTKYKELRIHVLNEKLEEQYKRFFVRAQSLEYVAAYSHRNGFYLFANLKGLNSSLMTYYNWSRASLSDSSHQNLIVQRLDRYTVDSVVPVDVGRYAVLIRSEDSIPYLIDCYQDFKYHSVIALGSAPALKTALLADSDIYYVYIYALGDVSSFYRFNGDMTVKDELAGFKKLSALYCHTVTRYGTLFCGRTVSSVIIAGTNKYGINFENAFDSVNETICTMIEVSDGFIIIGETAGTGLNVGGNFGGTDIWAAKLVF